jgi:hypothetical protein
LLSGCANDASANIYETQRAFFASVILRVRENLGETVKARQPETNPDAYGCYYERTRLCVSVS